MKKLLIIDGHLLLFQSYFGMPNKIYLNNDLEVSGVICFIGILRKTLEMLKPDYLHIVFDGENKLLRQDIDKGYKANRPTYDSPANNPFTILSTIKTLLSDTNISYEECINMEADDRIAGICLELKDIDAVISSKDKDFLQLINDNISVFCYNGKNSKLWDKDTFVESFGFSPEQYVIYKSLVGDSSDNIKGVPHIGDKTAKKLIKEYGNLDNILNCNDTKLNTLINEYKQKVNNNYKIINLLGTMSQHIDLEKCKVANININDLNAVKYFKQKGLLQ